MNLTSSLNPEEIASFGQGNFWKIRIGDMCHFLKSPELLKVGFKKFKI